MICPQCGHENIEGVDSCDRCGASLVELTLPEPATEVERSLLHDRISVLNPKLPVSVYSTAKVGDVLDMMVRRGIGSVLVIDDGQLVGIFSERDALLKLNTEAESLSDRPVSAFMTANPSTLEENSKVAFAVQRMDLGSFRHIPIVNDAGRTFGIVSVRDILGYLTQKMTA